jgi:hypothetical protein
LAVPAELESGSVLHPHTNSIRAMTETSLSPVLIV